MFGHADGVDEVLEQDRPDAVLVQGDTTTVLGAAIAAGWGLPSTGAVGCALTLGGLAVWGIAWWDGRRAPLVADKAALQC